MPVPAFTQRAANQRTHEGAEVNTHIKHRKSGIAPCTAFGIKLANHRADIGFQQPGTQSNQDQAQKKTGITWDGHAEVSGCDDASTYKNSLSLYPAIICNTSPGQYQKINRSSIRSEEHTSELQSLLRIS